MKVRILAVEDNDRHYRSLVSILRAIPDIDKETWGIEAFEFVRAASLAGALAKLKEAANQDSYDMLVLDLEIPKSDQGPNLSVNHGFAVLNAARKLAASKQIVIYTKFKSDENILKALREGANDFIEKPQLANIDEQELQNRFLTAWQRLLENESFGLLEERIKGLIPYAEAGLAQRFTTCFSGFLQKVAHTAEDVEHYAAERFGLDPEKDSQDYLIRSLRIQEEEMKGAQKHWANLNADLTNGDGNGLTPVPLDKLLDSICRKWEPCMLVKNCIPELAKLNAHDAGVLTFQDDVRIIVQEIIAGALSSLPDHGAGHELTVRAQMTDEQATIQFFDKTTSDALEGGITPEDARMINEGSILGPNHGPKRFGRAWGLSVVQHLALRGGGRLIAQPQPHGNLITYFAPLERSQNLADRFPIC